MKLSKMSLAIDFSYASSVHCVLQQPLTLLCNFTWPTTLCPSCCYSQLLPLFYNTTNS
ncbi:unnamed protein product [Staurois parvus]|uniref:Uncharacterized protein n=1 Tax=Staurois parvus TaxID=386267 RepID=A0ABN9FQX0_9NEOB|nr:unnamed protein product [Staurois parvus]